VLYTDGITEAENGTKQELGREQLLDWARRGPVDSAKTLGEDLLQRLESFRGGLRSDDETLLVLQRISSGRIGRSCKQLHTWPAAEESQKKDGRLFDLVSGG
jgi:hypothetical protein